MKILEGNPVVQRILSQGERQVGKLANQLMGNPRFVTGLQTLVQRTLSAKGFMDKNLRRVLSAFNLPSTADVRALHDRLDDLERLVGELDEKLSALAGARPQGTPQARA
jgi:polyhydroxyalkanoate synthesis regulator phasin